MKTTFIYGLIDPNTNIIRYIGKSDKPKTRLSNHIQTSKKSKTHKSNWINSLIKEKKKPIITILEEVNIENWEEREKFWIKKYKDDGYDVTNFTNGGEGGEKIHFIDKIELYKKYIIENLSINECVKYFNIPQTTIYRNLVEYDIKKDKNIWQKQCANDTSKLIPKKIVLKYNLEFNLIGEFNGLKAAAESVNKEDISGISACCSGKKLTTFGFIWKYKEDNITIDKSYLDNQYSFHNKKVLQYDLQGNLLDEFSSITEAAKSISIDSACIGACCRNKSKSSGGFIWKYK